MQQAGFAVAVAMTTAMSLFCVEGSSAQQNGIAGSWKQVSSNAGDCPTCAIEIRPRGTTPGVFDVIANNGWSGQIKAGQQGGEGMGRWESAPDGSQPGQPFSLVLQAAGGQLALRMRVGSEGPIEGRFARAAAITGATPGGEFKAGSWGGIVRSGPGMEFAKVTSLAEGDPITVVENSGVMMNGYPWFKIRYRGNSAGYHWGGIMCAIGQPVAGLLETCPQTASAGGQPAAADGVVGPIDYTCDEGIPLRVIYDNRGPVSIATVTHDSALTVKLKQVVSGSGIRYTDGTYTLLSKGNSAIFSWGDGQHACTED